MTDLDSFEQDILNSIENDEWQSKGDIPARLAELQGFLKTDVKQRSGKASFFMALYKSLNLRVNK